MHILVVPSWYSTPDNPVRGSFFREQALALRKAGHRVGILVPPTRVRTWHGLREVRGHWREAPDHVTTEDDVGMATYRIPWWGWRGLVSLAARGQLASRIFDRYVQDHGMPDVIHAHSALYGGFIAAWIGQARGLPVVLTEHATFILRGQVLPGQGAAIRYALRGSSKRLAVGAALVEALRRYAPALDYEVLGNTIDTDFFTPTDSALPSSPFRFAVIGHLYPKKRIDILLMAFAKAFRGEPVELHVGGDGPERQRLAALARSLAIGDQIHFHGRLAREAVRGLIRASHVVVSSSAVETFGVTLAEAMACGKPVVATRSGGPESFVHAGNGLLVPVGSVEALALALMQIQNDYTQYDSAQIRAECVARFSEAAIVRRLESIYGELTGAD